MFAWNKQFKKWGKKTNESNDWVYLIPSRGSKFHLGIAADPGFPFRSLNCWQGAQPMLELSSSWYYHWSCSLFFLIYLQQVEMETGFCRCEKYPAHYEADSSPVFTPVNIPTFPCTAQQHQEAENSVSPAWDTFLLERWICFIQRKELNPPHGSMRSFWPWG